MLIESSYFSINKILAYAGTTKLSLKVFRFKVFKTIKFYF